MGEDVEKNTGAKPRPRRTFIVRLYREGHVKSRDLADAVGYMMALCTLAAFIVAALAARLGWSIGPEFGAALGAAVFFLILCVLVFLAAFNVNRADQAEHEKDVAALERRLAEVTDKPRRAKAKLKSLPIDPGIRDIAIKNKALQTHLDAFRECFVLKTMSFEFGFRDICLYAFHDINEMALGYAKTVRDQFVAVGVIELDDAQFRLSPLGRDLIDLLEREATGPPDVDT